MAQNECEERGWDYIVQSLESQTGKFYAKESVGQIYNLESSVIVK